MTLNKTNIPWADVTWNPITGCTKGCEYCYARAIAKRFGGGFQEYAAEDECRAKRGEAFPYGFMPTVYEHRLDEPLRSKKPLRIFLGSMGDIFDPAFPDEFRDRIFARVGMCPAWPNDAGPDTGPCTGAHTFLLLTKQPAEMHRYWSDPHRFMKIEEAMEREGFTGETEDLVFGHNLGDALNWPNLWLGVTVTNQADADERIPLLLDTPAAHRWVSVEPMLGAVDLTGVAGPLGQFVHTYDALRGRHCHHDDGSQYTNELNKLDWVVVGGKTPGKPLHGDDTLIMLKDNSAYCEGDEVLSYSCEMLRSLRDQCAEASVPFFYKHGGTIPELDGVKHDALGVTA